MSAVRAADLTTLATLRPMRDADLDVIMRIEDAA